MNTEASARWELYEMTPEQLNVLIEGAECMYSRGIACLYEDVAQRGTDHCEDLYKKVSVAHDLLGQLRGIYAAITAPADEEAQEA